MAARRRSDTLSSICLQLVAIVIIMPTPITPRFDTFYRHDALTVLLFDYAQAHPDLVSVASIGKSYEGRDIWLATVTHTATGAAEDKPAFWADGNIHAAELTSWCR